MNEEELALVQDTPAESLPTDQAPVTKTIESEVQTPAAEPAAGEPALTATQQEEVDTAHDQFEKTGTWPEGTPKWVQKVVNRVTKQKHEFRTRAEEVERENASLKEQLKTLQASIPPPVFDKPEPTIDQFETEHDYTVAVAEWVADKREFGRKAEVKPAPVVAPVEVKPVPTDLGAKVMKMREEGSKKHADFAAVIDGTPAGYFTLDLAEAITETENPEDVAYLLATNLALGEKLAGMTPVKRAIAIGEISTQLKTPITKRLSNAPDPITPVTGNIVNNGTTVGDDIGSLERILRKG